MSVTSRSVSGVSDCSQTSARAGPIRARSSSSSGVSHVATSPCWGDGHTYGGSGENETSSDCSISVRSSPCSGSWAYSTTEPSSPSATDGSSGPRLPSGSKNQVVGSVSGGGQAVKVASVVPPGPPTLSVAAPFSKTTVNGSSAS